MNERTRIAHLDDIPLFTTRVAVQVATFAVSLHADGPVWRSAGALAVA